MTDKYILYVTRKLESALLWYGLPFIRQAKTIQTRAEIDQRSGTHQMPALLTPENWMLADTTPIMMLLDSRFPRRAMFAYGPLGVLVHAIEEYFDEWVARVMVHYRWHNAASAQFAADRLIRQQMAGASEAAIAEAVAQAPIASWGLRACALPEPNSPASSVPRNASTRLFWRRSAGSLRSRAFCWATVRVPSMR